MKNKVVTVTMNPAVDKTLRLDQLIPYGLNRVKGSRIELGGKGINVARVLSDFNVDVEATGLIAGKTGTDLLNQMKLEGISNDFLKVDGEIRTNLKILEESSCRITEINEPGFFVSSQDLKIFIQKLEALLEDADLLVLSGSLPPGVPEDFYASCIHLAEKKGVRAILDSSGTALAKGVEALPYAIKPNLLELEELCGKEFRDFKEIVEAAKKLVQIGIELVMVSLGADGIILVNSRESFKTSCWSIDVKSTVGAGDSVVAALAYSIMKQDTLSETIKLATAAGIITAMKEGTQTCELDEVLNAKAKVSMDIL